MSRVGVSGAMSMFGSLAKRLGVAALLVAAGVALAGAAQEGAADAPQEAGDALADHDSQAFKGQVSVGYVLVPVVVRARNGFADRLEAENFQLRVDGRLAEIESFESAGDAPIGVLFLQDLSGSMGVPPKLTRSRQLVRCILGHQRPGDEFAVASFSDESLFVDVPFTGSDAAIREAAARWTGYGRTALHDAIAWLPDIVHSRASPRRAVVLVTDGVDNASETGPEEARNEMRQAEVPVHVVGLETGSFQTLHPDGGKMYRLADMLNLIGWATGGGYHPVTTSGDMRTACGSIVSDLRHQYILGFSTRGEGRPGRHTLSVTLNGRSKKLKIDHRRSYEGTLPRTMKSSR